MNTNNLLTSGVCVGGLLISAVTAGAAPSATVEVDASAAPRGIERAHLVLPVKPGPLTLLYPKWLPGEHGPTGPIGGLSGLKFEANGRPLVWRRDSDDMYAFHIAIPSGVSSLDVSLEVLAVRDANPPNDASTSTESLAIILWNQLLLYPAGARSDDLQYAARLKLPPGWTSATALPKADATGDVVQFQSVSLTTLIDSPVLAGRYVKTVALGGQPNAFVHFAADSDAALNVPEATLTQLKKLVSEASALFGATHYREYHFLWTLSDLIAYEGIEHHESSDNRTAERALIDDDMRHSWAVNTLLPHEFVHSWNGKYRRPIGLATGNYDAPMRGDLLWVYEGLTEYLGMVLSARSGLATPEDARDGWADIAARMDSHKGREWRPLADTAVAAQLGYVQPVDWAARMRSTDFYRESALLWLEADTLIRDKSRGGKSLDDFCRLFYGPPSGGPKVVTYDFEAIVSALNTVLPYDWRAFWTERLERIKAGAPLAGLNASGWRLGYSPEPTSVQKGDAAMFKELDLRYSLGFTLLDEGHVVTYLIPGTPADQAGMAPGSKVIAVNGRKYSKDVLEDALRETGLRTISLLIEKDETFKTYDLQYAGGSRYPRLERDSSTADVLSVIGTARTP
jgi:predicted metalloprotease with PDZ domain